MKITLGSILLFLTIVSKSQENFYLADLAALKTIVQKTASYKAQIKNDKQFHYTALYDRLILDTASTLNSYKYFYNLSQLLFPLRDNHLGFYQIPDYNKFKTEQSIDSFLKTKDFLEYPTYKINIDSLKIELAKKPLDSLEGIYHYDRFYTVGIFKNGDKEYIGIILSSEVSLWVKGQIAVHLYAYAPNLYKAIYGHPKFKSFILQPIEKFQNQSLVNSYFYGSYSQSVYSKQLTQVDHVNIPKGASKFSLKSINDDVQYLLLQTFQANSTTAQASQRFYDSISNSIKASNLILDLRNNEGGAEKEMIKYLKFLTDYVRNGHLYVLLNNNTLSQAEIFTLKLKQLKNVTTVGQTTKGMLSYGSNYGRTETLPSLRFAIYPTDMNNGSELLEYEDYGIKPDILLRDDRDWIEQIVDIIQKK